MIKGVQGDQSIDQRSIITQRERREGTSRGPARRKGGKFEGSQVYISNGDLCETPSRKIGVKGRRRTGEH